MDDHHAKYEYIDCFRGGLLLVSIKKDMMILQNIKVERESNISGRQTIFCFPINSLDTLVTSIINKP